MTMPPIVALDGLFAPAFRKVNLARDLAEFAPVEISSKYGTNAWPKWLDWYVDSQLPDGPFVACGFSAGAPAAARLAERNPNCVGLIYISGLEWRPAEVSFGDLSYEAKATEIGWLICDFDAPVFRRRNQFPTLCLATAGELDRLTDGTRQTASNLREAGAYATYHKAPNPGHRRPHMHGISHHLPAIRDWWAEYINKEDEQCAR